VGRYGEWAVDPAGKIVVSGTPYLAGSNQNLTDGLSKLMDATGWDFEAVSATVTTNPGRLLGMPLPFLNIGDFWEGSIWAVNEVDGSRSIKVLETWIQGERFEVG